MNSKENNVYSWQSGGKPKAYTSFVLHLKVFKDDLYLIILEKMAHGICKGVDLKS